MPILAVAFGKTLQTLSRPSVWKIILLSALLTIGVGCLLVAAVWWVFHATTISEIGWVEWMVDWLGAGLVSVVALLLFPFTFPLVISVFGEAIANQVEKQEYAAQYSHKINPPLLPQLWDAVKFLLVALSLNMLLLPLYFIPVLNLLMFFLYYAVNGYVLGREFFSLVAIRYLPVKDVETLRKAHFFKVTVAGSALLALSVVPGVNLFIPAVAVIGMVHLYHQLTK